MAVALEEALVSEAAVVAVVAKEVEKGVAEVEPSYLPSCLVKC